MRKTFTGFRRLISIGSVLSVLLLLGACGKGAASSSSGSVPDTNAAEVTAGIGASSPSGHISAEAPLPADFGSSGDYGDSFSLGKDSVDYPSMIELSPESIRDAAPESPSPSVGTAYEPETPLTPGPEPSDAQPFILTAAEWNDNDNWPFFTNLVNSGSICFPVFGIDPTHRITVTLTDSTGASLVNEPVTLLDAEGNALWQSRTDRDGTAYLFYSADSVPGSVTGGGTETSLSVSAADPDDQGSPTLPQAAEVTLVGAGSTAPGSRMQIMFIVDTTGSMSDELAYLQKDFSAIAEDVGSNGVSYCACFYRDEGDEYVTRCGSFTSDVSLVQAQINGEYADGGGDTPEAVAEILTETLTADGGWEEDSTKLAFLIFDAPPHSGKEAELDAAVRAAAARGIHLIPVVASNADRDTELFGRALAICTNGTYVFLTDDSGVGDSHLEPIVGNYQVEILHDLIVRIIEAYR